VGWVGPHMCSIDRDGDHPIRSGNFGDGYGAADYSHWGICGIAEQKCVK